VAEAERLCGECWDRLAVRLREVPGLVDELEVTITRQDKVVASSVGSSGHKETPLPFNGTASLARTELRHFLGSWARDAAERSGAALPTTVDRDVISDAARWLLEHEGAVRHHPAADDLCEEITNAVWGAVRAIDRPPDRVFAGWCCGAVLYARPGATSATCRWCETGHDVRGQRDLLLRQLEDRHETAADAARILGALGVKVNPRALSVWAGRGRLARTEGRRPTYRLGDVVAVVAETAA